MVATVQKILIVVVVGSTLLILIAVLCLVCTMPDLPRKIITDEICLPDHSGELVCGRTEKKLYHYTKTWDFHPTMREVDKSYHLKKPVWFNRLDKRIDSELKKLYDDYEAYVKGVNNEKEKHHIELKKFVDEKYFSRKPSARVVMRDTRRKTGIQKDVKTSSSNVTMVTIHEWQTNGDLRDNGGFLRFGMLCNDGRIMVPVTGTYAVSSFVDMATKPGKNGKSLRHALYKYNLKDNREIELVSNLQPKQNYTARYANEHSSFLNTIVKLGGGDEISVKVSNNADLPKPDQNYLSVYLI